MLAAAHARAFDAVVCWKLDRLGRSLKHLVTTIEDLSAYGVAFISLRDNLDLSTPSGRLMMHIIGAMAQFERELIKERVSAGMHAARKRGSRIGRPRAYANADKIRALRAQDVPWRTIAAQLGIGTGTAIYYNNGASGAGFNSNFLTGSQGTWTSNNPLVGFVNESGEFWALNQGQTTVKLVLPNGVWNEWIMYVGAPFPG